MGRSGKAYKQLVPPLSPAEKLAADKNKALQVCVTGATGYLAGHIVQRLLAAGHTVHGTARNADNAAAVRHLLAMPGADEQLRLFSADLMQPGSFDEAVKGCDVVIHTASPYQLNVPKGKEEELMIRPAVFGTENVLASVSRSPGVTAVVLTASTVSVWSDPHERGKRHVFTEADWNTSASPTTFPYFYAKTRAEHRAYEVHADSGAAWRLVSINPGAIWGPPTSDRTDGESVGQMADLLSGALWPWAPPLGVGVVDVRDVAMAHCIAAVTPSACGRFLLNSGSENIMSAAAAILRKAYPRRWLPPLKPPRWSLLVFGPMLGLPTAITRATYRKKPLISTAKAARELGMVQYISVKQSVLDMAEAMLSRGMVRARVPKALPVMAIQLAVLAALCGLLYALYCLAAGGRQ